MSARHTPYDRVYIKRKSQPLKDWLYIQTTTKLELVVQTDSHDVVSAYTGSIGEGIVIQQVDFVINEGGHVFVEVVGRAQVYVFNQILVAEDCNVFTFGFQVSNGRTQTEVELVLSNGFKVLRFICNTSNT